MGTALRPLLAALGLPMGRKGKRPEEGQYVPLPYAMLRSAAWRSLSGAAVRVFFELHVRYNGGNNGALTLSYAEAAEALGLGKATVQRAYRELVAKGFLALEKEGNWYHRHAHEWRLTTKPVQRVRGKEPPTHDWRNFRPEKAERGSETGRKAASVVPCQNPSAHPGSILKPVTAKTRRRRGSGSEH